mmetsp:Transcript_1252/g.3877  ORF Transcript_1252/g.3877 Transcript_1252/m.3877 type:complete len:240 (+) Transcript_1252:2529-3248(+)
MEVHLANTRVPGRPRRRPHCERHHDPGWLIRCGGGCLLPEGLGVRAEARHTQDLHILQQRGARRLGGGAEAVREGQVERPRRASQGLRLPLPHGGGLRALRAWGRGRPQGRRRGQHALRAGSDHRGGHEVDSRGHRGGEPPGQRPHRRGDLAGLRGDLHALVHHRPLGGHRGLPQPPGPAHHPEGRGPHDPHGLPGPEQAPRPRRLQLAGPARRPAGHGAQRRDPPARAERPGGCWRHP